MSGDVLVTAHDKENSSTIRLKKSLGQNFLKSQSAVERIVDLIGNEPSECVEIGPGAGAMTRLLLKRGHRVHAFEIDRRLEQPLGECFGDDPGFQLYMGDYLKSVIPEQLAQQEVCVVSNLPYHNGTAIIKKVLADFSNIKVCVFMVQKEVALRLEANPGTKAYGGLSVWVQTFAVPRILFHVSPHCFHPRPRVDSSVVGFVPRPLPGVDKARLTRTIHLLFQKRRKQLGTILKPFQTESLQAWMDEEGIDRRLRPENLTPEQFVGLSKCW